MPIWYKLVHIRQYFLKNAQQSILTRYKVYGTSPLSETSPSEAKTTLTQIDAPHLCLPFLSFPFFARKRNVKRICIRRIYQIITEKTNKSPLRWAKAHLPPPPKFRRTYATSNITAVKNPPTSPPFGNSFPPIFPNRTASTCTGIFSTNGEISASWSVSHVR